MGVDARDLARWHAAPGARGEEGDRVGLFVHRTQSNARERAERWLIARNRCPIVAPRAKGATTGAAEDADGETADQLCRSGDDRRTRRCSPSSSAAAAKARRGPRARRSAPMCPRPSGPSPQAWDGVFRNGVMDHAIKELCRVYVSRSVKCEYCGNQRSVKSARSRALVEADYKDLLDFEKSTRYDERQKAALAYAEAITWDLDGRTTRSGQRLQRISPSRRSSSSAISSPSPWASSAGCARSTSSIIRCWPAPMRRWRPGSRRRGALARASPTPDYWAKGERAGAEAAAAAE